MALGVYHHASKSDITTAFLFGVLALAFTCLLYGMAPEWFPVAYTVQAAFYMPIRIYTYHRKAWHYFLFGEFGLSWMFPPLPVLSARLTVSRLMLLCKRP